MKPPRPAHDPAEVRKTRVRRLLTGAVALGLVVLLGVSAMAIFVVADYQGTTRWVDHTYLVERVIADMRVDLARVESARRGFLITRDPYYSMAFRETATDLPRLEERFQALTSDSPHQQANAEMLRVLFARKLAEQDASLQAVAGGEAVTADLIRENQRDLDQIRNLLIAMMAEEGRLLIYRTDLQNDEAEELLAVVLGAAVVLAGLASTAFLLVRRYADDLNRSQSALQRLNTHLEDEVRKRTADLTLANEEIQRFAYIVSHDLRSPLVNVMGFTSELETALKSLRELAERLKAEAPHLLSRGAAEAVDLDLPESIGFIRTSTQKMDRLINAILRLSREGRRTLAPEPIAMPALFAGVAGSLKQQTDDRGATVEVEGSPPDLVNDRLAVEQVFGNVVENALKYLKPGRAGLIRIRGRSEDGANVYEVEDNGRGIDPKDHERVFELFRRAGPQDQPGEGIGLAHVRALVYRLGGTITVDSALDRGATFRVSLPPVLNRVETPK